MIDLEEQRKADKARYRKALREVDKARDFPTNTCPESRHAQMIAEALLKRKTFHPLTEEPEHCGESIMWTVISLYKARTRIAEFEAQGRQPGAGGGGV